MQPVTGVNGMLRLLAILLLAASAAGCAGAKPIPDPMAPTLSKEAAQTAVAAGVESLAAFRLERVASASQRRAPDYTVPRADLASALSVLRPPGNARTPVEFERAALCLETSLAGMDRISAAAREKDPQAEAVGWAIFDRAAGELLLALEPGASASAKGASR